jgi:signal transduction histidine kinase
MSRPQQRSLLAWALGISLVVAVGSIGVLAYQAVGLDRSHRAVAEGVLRDYSAFAADQFSRLAAERVTALSKTILAPVACGESPQARRAAAVDRTAAPAQECSCGNSTAVDGFFEADPSTGRLVFTTGRVDDSIREAVTRLARSGPFGFGLLSGDGPPRIVGQWADAVPGVAKGVVGFVAPAAILQPIFEQIVRNERLLPGLLIEPAQNREYLTIDVRDAHGASVYRSGDDAGAFATDRAVGSPDGNMQVRLAINQAAAGRLIIGGVPRSRLPLLLSLLAAALGLLTVGAWQVQREHRIARMQVDFVRSASHELRTPLAQIRLFTETLQLGRVRSWAEVQTSMAFVDQQSRRLSRLVENLLTFAHEGQQRRARLEPIELGAFLLEASRGFQPIVEAVGQQLRLDESEPCVVRADREWLTQVVLNLLDNATKYGPAGQTITVRVERDDQRARIVIDDEGPGIPSTDRKRIFAPFVRLSREHEQRTGGTGIGLAVASELMSAMNGTIWAETGPSGARLIVALPVVAAGAVSGSAALDASGPGGHQSSIQVA